MPYSKFTTKEIIKKFHLKDKKETIFKETKMIPSSRLKEELNDAFSLEINSEKASRTLRISKMETLNRFKYRQRDF